MTSIKFPQIDINSERFTMRVVTITCLASIAIAITLAFALVMVASQKERVPYFFTNESASGQMVHVEPIEVGKPGYDLLLASLAAKFVKLRETINHQDEVVRWGKLGFFMSSDMCKEFNEREAENSNTSFLKAMHDAKLVRKVKIIDVSKLREDIMRVEWQAIDCELTNPTQIRKQQDFVATLTIEVIPQLVEKRFELINPVGFQVIKYQVVERNLSA